MKKKIITCKSSIVTTIIFWCFLFLAVCVRACVRVCVSVHTHSVSYGGYAFCILLKNRNAQGTFALVSNK